MCILEPLLGLAVPFAFIVLIAWLDSRGYFKDYDDGRLWNDWM